MSRKKSRELLPVTSQVQEIPSVELHTFPALPTATNLVPVQRTFSRSLPLETVFHWVPSGDTAISPPLPTATNFAPSQTRSVRSGNCPRFLSVHVMPSGEVDIKPLAPTATKRPSVLDHATWL